MKLSRSIHLMPLIVTLIFFAILALVWVGSSSKAYTGEQITFEDDTQVASQEADARSFTAKYPLSPALTSAAIYYARPDGGSAEQCTGLVDAPFMPGSGSGEPCAWNHPFQAWPPGGTAHIGGGDTLIIGSGEYRMGYDAHGAESCDYGASYECHMAPIPSGPDPTRPTRILGAGRDTGCTPPPELGGTGRPWFVVNLTDSSNIELACLEITDHSSCIEDHLFPTGGSEYTCERDIPPYGEWAATGLYAEASAHVPLTDLTS